MKTRIGFPDLKDMNFQIEWRVCVLRPINEDPCQDLGSWTWRTYVKKTPLPPESSKETKELMKTWALGSLSEIPEARRQWRKVFKILKENYLQPRILDATKLSILIDNECTQKLLLQQNEGRNHQKYETGIQLTGNPTQGRSEIPQITAQGGPRLISLHQFYRAGRRIKGFPKNKCKW